AISSRHRGANRSARSGGVHATRATRTPWRASASAKRSAPTATAAPPTSRRSAPTRALRKLAGDLGRNAVRRAHHDVQRGERPLLDRSEEHTSELQSR